MSSDKDAPGKPPGKPPSESTPKKPTPIIDLKATEVRDDKSAAAQSGKPPSSGTPTAGPQSTTPPAGGAKPGATAGEAGAAKPKESSVPPVAGAAKPAAPTGTTSAAATAAASAAEPSKGGKDPKDTKDPKAATSPPPAGAAKPAQPSEVRRGGGSGFLSTLTHLAAGLVGGFFALLGADTIGQGLGFPPDRPAAVAPELAKRIAALESAVRQPSGDVASSLADLQQKAGEVDALRTRLAELAGAHEKLQQAHAALAARGGSAGSGGADAQRLARLEESLRALSAAAGTDPAQGRIPQLAAISGRINDLETTLNTQIATLRTGVAQELETRVQQIAEASQAAQSGAQRLDRDLSAVKTDVTRQGQRLEALAATDERIDRTVRVVQEELGGLKSALDGLRGDFDQQLKGVARPKDVTSAVEPLTSKLSALEQSIQSVVNSEADRKANAERIVLALELGNLKRGIDRGGAYASELAEVKRIGGGRLDLAMLERFKDQGVPTMGALLGEFQQVAHQIIESEAEPANASVVDRLMSGAKSIVRVRRTTFDADDQSAEATVARIEAALKAGQAKAVLEQAARLSQKARAPAAAWLAKIEARAAVENAIAAIEAQLKTSLGGAQPAGKG